VLLAGICMILSQKCCAALFCCLLLQALTATLTRTHDT